MHVHLHVHHVDVLHSRWRIPPIGTSEATATNSPQELAREAASVRDPMALIRLALMHYDIGGGEVAPSRHRHGLPQGVYGAGRSPSMER